MHALNIKLHVNQGHAIVMRLGCEITVVFLVMLQDGVAKKWFCQGINASVGNMEVREMLGLCRRIDEPTCLGFNGFSGLDFVDFV